jgi:hypothetical protein
MIASTADVVGTKRATGSLARVADRWIYVFMAALFVVTALVGFIPDSIGLVATVQAGQRPPLPPIVHAHAILMASWLAVLLAQTTLMATGRSALHKKLGLIGFALLPLLVAAMIGITKEAWTLVGSIPPGAMAPEALSALKFDVGNTLLEQIRVIVLFPGLVAWALFARRKDPETHKRLMILATLLPLPAAIDRMTWLPATLPGSPASIHLYSLLWLLPVLAYDVARRGRVHRAYVIGIALNIPFVVASHFLWGSAWWLATAPRLMGAQAW